MSEKKVGVVTGGGQGIGKAILLSLASSGTNVVSADINLDTAAQAAEEAAAAGVKAIPCEVNVADAASVEELIGKTIDTFGRIDFLVNNAGITRDSLLMRMKDDAWNAVINVNLNGTYLCSRTAVSHMIKQRFGRIVNISSVVGAMGNIGQTNYAASKAGVVGFTKALAREVAQRNITVNAVAPGFIQTAMTDSISEKARDMLISQIPIPRLGTPDDISSAVMFLLSDDASYITGQLIAVNGGMYM